LAEPAAVGQIYRVTFKGTLNGQQVQNHFDYRLEVLPAAFSVVDTYASMYAYLHAVGNLEDKYVGCTPSNLAFDVMNIQCIKPVRIVGQNFTIGRNGDRGPADTPNIQQSITRRGERAAKFAVGGVRVPVGTTADDIAIGYLTGAQATALEALATQMLAQLGNGTTLLTWRPVIFNPSFIPNFQYVIYTQRQLTIRTQHRRTVGLGK